MLWPAQRSRNMSCHYWEMQCCDVCTYTSKTAELQLDTHPSSQHQLTLHAALSQVTNNLITHKWQNGDGTPWILRQVLANDLKQTGWGPQCPLLLVHWFYWEPEALGEHSLGCNRLTLFELTHPSTGKSREQEKPFAAKVIMERKD